jgi:hypothetical protein
LVQARNNLVLSIIATGSITYILLVMASLTNTPPVTLVGAVTYYIIGAAVGLFGRLYNESITGSAINDYGLSLSRLMAAPLLSGLAAIGGVLLVAALPAANGPTIPTLQSVFTLTPYYLVIAAVFGLTPNLLIKGLQARSDKLVSDLESARSPVGLQVLASRKRGKISLKKFGRAETCSIILTATPSLNSFSLSFVGFHIELSHLFCG